MKGKRHASTSYGKYFPRYGELWDCEGRVAIICGNCFSDGKTIWIMEWSTGLCGYARAEALTIRKDRKRLSWGTIVRRFEKWAWAGNPDAMWWLAWWFEGVHHPRSVWTYIAALRADPQGHGWALNRICSDAHSAVMCEGTPKPDLAFLQDIPEIQGAPIGTDWLLALEMSLNVPHLPVEVQSGE